MDTDNLFLCPICKDIPLEERESFLNNLKFKAKYYKKGDFIATQGDVVDSLFLLLKGSVKTEMFSESGTVLNIETIIAPNPLAPAFLFAENNRFPVDVIAMEDSEVMVIPKDSVIKLLSVNEAFLRGYMAFNSNRTNFLSERLKLLSIKTIKGKLAQYILSRANNLNFEMDMNQTELAEYFGVARPSLARSLSEIIDDNIICLEKRRGQIVNMNALKELLVQ